MADPAEDFILKFHALEGVTVANRRKNFFKLLMETPLETEALDKVSKNLVPNTYLETLLKLELLIYYRRTSELHDVLKEGNEVFVAKIAKQLWFFQHFAQFSGEELVNEILPCTSFSARMKILKRLSQCLDNRKFDEIFDAVSARYGIYVASNFVTGCSVDKVKQIFRNYCPKLTSNKLKLLFLKDSSLVDTYFDEYKQNNGNNPDFNDYETLFSFILMKNVTFFWELKRKCHYLKLGRRCTKKLVAIERNEIVANPRKYGDSLHKSSLIRCLGSDFKKFFSNYVDVTSINNISFHELNSSLLRYYPQKNRFKLFVETIEDRFKTKIENHPDIITQQLLEVIPETPTMNRLAQLKQAKAHFLKYLSLDQSIPLIKQKINLASTSYDRQKLVAALVETCHLNKSNETLKEVLQYFCSRHRNDQHYVQSEIFYSIEGNFNYNDLTEEMWSSLQELLTFYKLKHGQVGPLTQTLAYIDFIFRQKKPVDDLILAYFRELCYSNTAIFYNNQTPEFGKYLLLFAIKNAAKFIEPKDDGLMNYDLELLNGINLWNHRHPDDKISFLDFPRLVQSVETSLNQGKSHSVIRDILRERIRKKGAIHEYMSFYWKHFSTYGDGSEDLLWFLKHNPEILVPNFEIFINQVLRNIDNQSLFWSYCKKYSHLQLDKLAIDFCLANLKNKEYCYRLDELVKCLSLLMPVEKYVNLANSNGPIGRKLDLNDKEAVELYNLQCAFAKNFKNCHSPQVLPNLLHFCVGDYFGSALQSLLSVTSHTPENQLAPVLEDVANRAVSVSKHALFITCQICDLTTTESIFKLIISNGEKAKALQKQLVATSFKLLAKNPSNRHFELLKTCVGFVNQEDEDTLDLLTNVVKVPKRYRADYVVFFWSFFDKTPADRAKILREKLLRHLTGFLVQQLPLEFCLDVRKNSRSLDEDCVDDFIFEIFINHNDRIVVFQEVVKSLDDSKKPSHFLAFYRKLMVEEALDVEFLKVSIGFWEKQINPIDNFANYINLFFLKMKMEFGGQFNIKIFGQKFVQFLDNLITQCGPYILHWVLEVFQDSSDYFMSVDASLFEFCQQLMEISPTPHIHIFVIQLIPLEEEPSALGDGEILHKNIIKALSQVPDNGVRVFFKSKFGASNLFH